MWNRAVLAAALILCWSRPGLAQEVTPAGTPEDVEPRARAEIGGLHRAAASLEAVLDLYRIALIDLVPAARRVHAAGAAAPAAPATLLPAPAVEVFGRLASSLPNRVPAKSLPVLARGYHSEVAEALDRLGSATQLGHVAAPLRQTTRAMQGVCASARSIVDLFSRQRPVSMELVDPDQMLGDVGQALDEVIGAERRILDLRKKRKHDLGAQFRAFRRLEVSLGHALDLIAMAEEGGLHIGFEVQLATEGFAALLARVEEQLTRLDHVVRQLEEPPVGISQPLSAWLIESAAGEVETRLRWQPPRGARRAAAVRIYRAPNLEGVRAALAASYRCEGRSVDQARALAERGTAELDDEAVLMTEEAPGKSTFAEAWEQMPLAPPRYRVVPVSAFGVEGQGISRVADSVPRALVGASEVRARALAPAADDPRFYQDHDAVVITWERSRNDVLSDVERTRLAAAEELPVVSWYRVLRVSEKGGAHNVGRVAAGVTEFVDRLDVDTLAAGLRYSVEALTATEDGALPSEECALSEKVQLDLSEELALASGGIAALGHPNRVEQETGQRLLDRGALTAAQEALADRPAPERESLVAGWWDSTPEKQRRAWLQRWGDLFVADERAKLLKEPPAWLCARDLPWAQVEVWLAGEPPEVRDEVDRWWRLLDPGARARAVEKYRQAANDNVVRWRKASHANPEGEVDWSSLRPVRVLTWVWSRDDAERAQLDQWWLALKQSERRAGFAAWYETLPKAEKVALHFPDWAALTEAEQAERTAAPPLLPVQLWRSLLTHVVWRDRVTRAGEDLSEILRTDVGGLTRALTRLRYNTRRFDVALGFRLRTASMGAVVIVGVLAVVLVRWRRRRGEAFRVDE